MMRRIILGFIGVVAGLALWQAPVEAMALPSGGQLSPVSGASQTSVVAPLSPYVASTASSRFKSSWSWYVSRASGMLAALLLAVLVASGIGLLTGHTYRVLEPLPAWAAHRAVGLAFGVMVIVHIFVLFFDKYVGFNLADLLIPFLSRYKSITIGGTEVGLYMALGVLALYGIIIIIVSSLLWMQEKPKPWRMLHYLSYAVLTLVFVHGLYIGTDLKNKFIRVLWYVGTAVLVGFILTRLRRVRTIGKGSNKPNAL